MCQFDHHIFLSAQQIFYLHPLVVPNGNVWFSCQARGHHTSEKVIKNLCKKGGITGKVPTTHVMHQQLLVYDPCI